MKTLADLKRTLTTGTVLNVTEHKFPSLNGERTVLKAQTKGFYLSLPDGHPKKADEGSGSWVDVPSAKRVRFEDGDAILLQHDGTQLCRLSVKATA